LFLLVLAVAGCSEAPTSREPPAGYSLCTDGKGSDAIASADRLTLDGETTAAAELYRARLAESATDGCAARGLAYIAATPPPRGWDAFFETWVRPAYQLALPLLAFLAVLLFTARGLTSVAVGSGCRAWDKVNETGLTLRRATYATGAAVLIAVALWVTVLSPLLTLPTLLRISFWTLALLLAAAGVWAVATARGLALRIRIEGRGDDGAALASHVLGQLQQLGSERPSGLSIPVNTDVTALPDDALSVLPQGDLAKAVFRAMQTLMPATPWHVTVSAVNEVTTTVEISRNGRLVDAAVFTHASEESRETRRAISAASFVLVKLADRHPSLKLGLNGVTRWRSLAEQVIAERTTKSPETQRTFLARAIETDPRNLAARIALLHVEGRRAGNADAARVYAQGIDAVLTDSMKVNLAEPRPEAGFDALLVRSLFNAAVTWMHCYLFEAALAGKTEKARHALRKALQRADAVDSLIKTSGKSSELREFCDDMRPAVGYLRRGIMASDAGPAPANGHPFAIEGNLSMTAVYTRACWHAIRGGDGLERALDDLAVACAMPGFADWARNDPSFHVFSLPRTPRTLRRRYRDLVGLALPVDFADLPPLRGHCDELRKLDAATPEALLREDPHDLARELKVTVARVRRWRSLAELAMLRSRRDGQRLPVATVSLLLAAGVNSVDALREALQQGDAFRDRLRKEINEQASDYEVENIGWLDIPPRREPVLARMKRHWAAAHEGNNRPR
jgi:hypothetical protein